MKEVQDKLQLYNMLAPQVKQLRKEIRIAKFKHALKNKKFHYAKRLIFAFVVLGFCISSYLFLTHYNLLQSLKKLQFTKKIPTADTIYVEDSTKNHKAFLSKIGFIESRNNYTIVNQYGYLGRYQIGRAALTAVGLGGITSEDFLQMPELQEIAMKLLLKRNKQVLITFIGKYQGKTIRNIYVTESGILAGAHLAGAGSIQQYLESGGAIDPADGNGTLTSKYLKEFSGYHLKF